MAGNLQEHTISRMQGLAGDWVVKGGNWQVVADGSLELRVDFRYAAADVEGNTAAAFGMRCVIGDLVDATMACPAL